MTKAAIEAAQRQEAAVSFVPSVTEVPARGSRHLFSISGRWRTSPNHREELPERPIPQDAESQLAEHRHSLKYLKGIISHQVAPGPQLSPSHPSELLPLFPMGVAYAFCNSPLISVCPWMTLRGLCFLPI